jgi:hypothetical protein
VHYSACLLCQAADYFHSVCLCTCTDPLTGRAILPPIHHIPSLFVRPSERSESHPAAVSRLCQYAPKDVALTSAPMGNGLSMDWFVTLARQYRLTGEPSSVLCERNADVATRAKRTEVAQTWRMLGIMVPTVASVVSTSFAPSAVSQAAGSLQSSQPPILLAPVLVTVSEQGRYFNDLVISVFDAIYR